MADALIIRGDLTDDEVVELMALLRRFDESNPGRLIEVAGGSDRRTAEQLHDIIDRGWPRVAWRRTEVSVHTRRKP